MRFRAVSMSKFEVDATASGFASYNSDVSIFWVNLLIIVGDRLVPAAGRVLRSGRGSAGRRA